MDVKKSLKRTRISNYDMLVVLRTFFTSSDEYELQKRHLREGVKV